MPKVFGMHEIELRPGVTPEEYEQFYAQELASLPEFEGWKPISSKAIGASGPGSFSCFSKSRARRRAIGTSPDRRRSRRR